MKKLIATLFIFAAFHANIIAQTSSHTHGYNTDKKGLAIDGYDPVAYFSTQKAVEGEKEIQFTSEGITYYFSSEKNRDIFKSNPGKYQPQYGGWCAYAMGAKGEKVEINPETFKIIDGKLYLFYNKFFNNTKKTWDKDESNLKTSADKNWDKLNH